MIDLADPETDVEKLFINYMSYVKINNFSDECCYLYEWFRIKNFDWGRKGRKTLLLAWECAGWVEHGDKNLDSNLREYNYILTSKGREYVNR